MGLQRNTKDGGPIYNFGRPVDPEIVRTLIKMSGLTVGRFAKHLLSNGWGVPATALYYCYSEKYKELRPVYARAIVAWQNALLQELLSKTHDHGYSPAVVLRTLFPDFPKRYSLVLAALTDCRPFLIENQNVGISELGQYICQQAMFEKVGKRRGNLFTRFLPLAVELIPHLDFDRARKQIPSDVAMETLARRLSVKRSAVYYATLAQTRPISPKVMRGLVMRIQRSTLRYPPLTRPKKSGGRPKEKEEGKRYYEIGLEVEKRIPIDKRDNPLAIRTAREVVATSRRFLYDVVAQYHKRFRRLLRNSKSV